MSETLVRLRIAGIAAFLLFILSSMYEFPPDSKFYSNQIRQILLVVSFMIFGILILLQLYGLLKAHVKEEEVDL